ncbi:MAG TPA: GNAT family N-acetyltransferase [Candidatus Tumulicola sp.]|jgi:ribosomal protein S18 acetylase RimI-like enzyme
MHIRTARPADFPVIESLPHALHYEHHLTFLRHALGTKESLVAEADGAIAGYAIWDRGFYARPFLWMLGVSAAQQRRGVASGLVERVESLNGGHVLYTSTNQSNAAMQRLLTGRGFVLAGRLDDLDPGDPELFYSKRL